MFESIVLVVTFVFVSIAAWLDFRTFEIPDWINYASVAAGLGIRLLYSIFLWDRVPIIEGVIGFVAAYIFGVVMFYGGLWGGGDSKLLMGIGALLGIHPQLVLSDIDFVAFFVDMIFIAALYSTVYCVVLAVKNRKAFMSHARKLLVQKSCKLVNKITVAVSVVLFVLALVFSHDEMVFFVLVFLAVFCILFFYLFIFIKAVELACVLKLVDPSVLTEGDWVAKDVVVGGKKVCGPGDLGVSKAQIRQLIVLYQRKKISKVLLKTGIPLVPGWWCAFLFLLWKGSLLKFLR